MIREEGTAVDPKAELSYTRAIELCFESVPGTVLQLAALIHAKEVDSVTYFALASSIVTAGPMSAYISWDWDMDKEMREEQTYFYGYIQKKSLADKVNVAVSLFLSSACCLLMGSIIFKCLAQKGVRGLKTYDQIGGAHPPS